MSQASGQILQENASQFFDKVLKKYPDKMECAKECNRCCYTRISIYPWEAELIIKYIQSLDKESRQQLLKKWSKKPHKNLNPHDELELSCTFLFEGKCTIYPARPIICRTQGLPLEIEISEHEKQLIHCPLNFKEELPPREDWLALDRLHSLSTLLDQTQDQLKDHPLPISPTGKIGLGKLKRFIITSLNSL